MGMDVVVTVTAQVAVLPFDSVTVIVALPAPAEVTVKVLPETLTVATVESLVVAV